MKSLKHKVIKVMALATIATALFSPVAAFADASFYALSCPGGTAYPAINGTAISCKDAAAKADGTTDPATVKAVGSTQKSVTNDSNTFNYVIVKADCGSGKALNPKHVVNDNVTRFGCGAPAAKLTNEGQQQAASDTSGAEGNGTNETDCTNSNSGLCPSSCKATDNSCVNCTQNGQDICSDPAASCKQDNCDLIAKYLNPTINLLTVLVGFVFAGSLIYGGITYAASGGDSQKVTKAKSRITKTIIAMVAYAFLYAFLQFLIPGGAFKS